MVPPAEAKQGLEELITSLSSEYNSPNFPPHVTLWSAPSTTAKPRDLLPLPDKLPKSIPIQYLDVRMRNSFYQSVLIALHLPPSGILQKLYDEVVTRATLAAPSPSTPYFPHLSLYYGDADTETKRAIVDDLEREGTVVYLRSDETRSCRVVGRDGFTVHEIWLVRTDGLPDKWEILEKIAL